MTVDEAKERESLYGTLRKIVLILVCAWLLLKVFQFGGAVYSQFSPTCVAITAKLGQEPQTGWFSRSLSGGYWLQVSGDSWKYLPEWDMLTTADPAVDCGFEVIRSFHF